MKIIPGPASKDLGEKMAVLLGVGTVAVSFRKHPDGESYVRLEGSVDNEEVAIVQTTSPPQDSRLLQLALLADASRRHGATRTTAVVPYLAYTRQDRVFLQGEAVSVEVVARFLQAAGVDRLLTVNVHNTNILSRFPFKATAISAIPILAEHMKLRGLDGAFSLAPDKGAVGLAEEASKILDGGCGYLIKQRDLHTGQITMNRKLLPVEGKDVIIFDDVISTGGTIASAAEIAKGLGANRVCAACVHPILIGEAGERIRASGVEELVGTDSVSSSASKVSLAPLLSQTLCRKEQ